MLFNNLAVRDCGKCCSYHLNEYIKLEEVKGSMCVCMSLVVRISITRLSKGRRDICQAS